MLLLFLSLQLAAPAAAQPADTVAVEVVLPEVSVVASREAVPAAEAPARVTLLGAREIEASGSRSVAELLEARSSLFVRRYGPAGLASVSFRGTGASQTLVLLDGHRIADPQLGQLDFALLPTILLERVEILHGAGSALHGTDGIGGVIDLRTLRPDGRSIDLATTLGAFGERGATGRVTLGEGTFRAVVAAEGSFAEGDFTYFDSRAGEIAHRTGADATLGSFFARGEADFDQTTAFAAVWAGTAERGIPGSIGTPTDARQADRHLRAWGGATTQLGWGTIRIGGLVQRASLRYNADEGRTTIASADVEARIPLEHWVISTGVTAGAGAADHPNLADDARESRLGAFVSAIGDYGLLLAYPALRADAYFRGGEQSLTALSPRLGLNWRPVGDWPLHLKAGAGSAFRAPTFNDRFWQSAEGAPGGDPDLKSERGWTADVGAYVEHGRLRAEFTAYGSWLHDQIVWLPAGGGFHAPVNVGRTRTLGLEVTAGAGGLSLLGTELDLGATYALTDSRDRSNPDASSYDQQLRYVPRHQVKAHAGARLDIGPRTQAGLDVAARYVSPRPVRTDGSLFEPAYLVADGRLRLAHRFDAFTASLTVGIENLFDADYAILRGYPMPPRHARIRLHLAL